MGLNDAGAYVYTNNIGCSVLGHRGVILCELPCRPHNLENVAEYITQQEYSIIALIGAAKVVVDGIEAKTQREKDLVEHLSFVVDRCERQRAHQCGGN